jgi:hypothetical protein
MAYSRKFAGLFGALGYDVMADCRNDSAETILAAFDDALARRDEIAARMQGSLDRGLARLGLYEAAVEQCLRATIGPRG